MSLQNYQTTPIWRALGREAATAAEHLAIGVTAVGRANYAEHAYYGQAFFALTTGFERTAKLAIVVDYALNHEGSFPPTQLIKAFRHDLKALLDEVDAIATRRFGAGEVRRPRSPIHDAIVDVLSAFATNVTRYFNIELATASPNPAGAPDPIRDWYERVTRPILERHYGQRSRELDEMKARLVDEMMGPIAVVQFDSETGNPLDSVYAIAMQTAHAHVSQRYARLYVMQIARFAATVMSELGYQAQKARLDDVPYLGDYFRIFTGPDELFKRRKTWSIYRP